MKKLIKVQPNVRFLPKPGEGRLYLIDELPPLEHCRSAFCFAFDGDKMLMPRLHKRDWDLPGGRMEE